MKVLAISGSYRGNGNTAVLVKQALSPFKNCGIESDFFSLGELSISGCRGCEGCRNGGKCVIDDDMQKLYNHILDADLLILGSPTYFFNVNALTKAFIDRCYPFLRFDTQDRSVWSSMLHSRKPRLALVIAVCEQESEKDMGVTADVMKMTLESLGYRIVDVMKVLHCFKPGDSRRNAEIMETALKKGKKLLKTAKLIEFDTDRM